MVTRIALFISTLAAALVLAAGISMATGSAAADTGPQTDPGVASLVDATATAPQVQIDTVYLPAPAAPEVITVQRTVTTVGDDENEHEGGDD
jgi:hypothetical protein